MNNLLSHYGLVDARISASEKDLPVHHVQSGPSISSQKGATRGPPLIFRYISAPNNVCGNGIVESWEECDCGETKRDCQDKCCYAADHRDLPCQLKERKTCR